MFDHVGYAVSDFEKVRAFYVAALAPLGIKPLYDITRAMSGGGYEGTGFGKERPQFWIGAGAKMNHPVHVAFAAESRALVDRFYEAALAAGGKDNGAPGLRPHYHAHYYGAFVLDPDGHNLEAVCHAPG
jgi:catechol 2,3-dioxygenase-like lactoylglutathione lyase family enzyme